MLIKTLSQYLESHKRLVVPQLGTFIVKEPGRSVLFSELLKRDDGVLRGLLREAGAGDLEAAGEIDRFVFEVRHAVQRGEEYPLEGFGAMKPGPNGTVAFEYHPSEQPGKAAAAEHPAVAAAKIPAEERSAETAPRERSAAYDEPKVSQSAKMNPAPYVRGLRYGKPPKNTDAYTYVDRAPRRRADRFIWIAVIAAAVAVAAIAFGYFREATEPEETEYVEETLPVQPEPQPEETAPEAERTLTE